MTRLWGTDSRGKVRRSPANSLPRHQTASERACGNSSTKVGRVSRCHPLGQTNPPLLAGPTGSPWGILLISMHS